MNSSKPFLKTLAAGAAGAALLFVPALHADGMATEEMAVKIQNELSSVPTLSGNNLTVRIEGDSYVIAGLVDDISAKSDVRDALEGIEGLDMSMLVNQVVVQ